MPISTESPLLKALVCFAMAEEAKPFKRLAGSRWPGDILVTGVGPKNAEQGLIRFLEANRPSLILTCGYAGGLNPELAAGDVVFWADETPSLEARLAEAGARRARFCASSRICPTAAEKRALWRKTGADAVEMESQAIRSVARQSGIPSAIVRVISDAANEDLPLDFNRYMTPDQRLDYTRLIPAIMASPSRIPALLKLQRKTRIAGERLATVLHKALGV